MRRLLQHTTVRFNRPADFEELSKKYDYVVVATGNDVAAKRLGVWEDCGKVYIHSALTLGEFDTGTQLIYFNTEYAGRGFGRLTPFSNYHAIVDLYGIGIDKYEMEKKFEQFLEYEGLSDLEAKFKMILPPFFIGQSQQVSSG